MALSPEATQFLAMTDADDVAAFFGATYPVLSRRIYRWRDDVKYHRFKIPKKTGGERQIIAPRKWLKEYQRQVATVLLELYRIRAPVHGFVQNRSIVTNALPHVNKRVVLNLDLEAFFETVNFGRVQGYFEASFSISRIQLQQSWLTCAAFSDNYRKVRQRHRSLQTISLPIWIESSQKWPGHIGARTPDMLTI